MRRCWTLLLGRRHCCHCCRCCRLLLLPLLCWCLWQTAAVRVRAHPTQQSLTANHLAWGGGDMVRERGVMGEGVDMNEWKGAELNGGRRGQGGGWVGG